MQVLISQQIDSLGKNLVLWRGVRKRQQLVAIAMAMTLTSPWGSIFEAQTPRPAQQEPATPMFRGGIDLVSVAATVHDAKGRVVRNLAVADFEVKVQGRVMPIVDFQPSDAGPISLALLLDASGSMRAAPRQASVGQVVDHLLSWFDDTRDEAAVFSFDRDLYEMEGFTRDVSRIRSAVNRLDQFGMTSVFDAVASTAKLLMQRESKRRAIVLLTDGQDNASRLTPEGVSGIASSIDVPVYVIAVLSPLDNPSSPTTVVATGTSPVTTQLKNLAAWTGGEVFTVSTPAQASVAVRQLIGELRHQYLLAFESAGDPGWHRLDIRMRRPNLSVRARGGYLRAS